MDTTNNQKITDEVKEYYGKTLQKSSDLKTNACCTNISYPDHIKSILSKIHDEVLEKYYGCGLTIPQKLDSTKVLDLGSGSGRDCYLLSALVGEEGEVVGIDMTQEQLDVANSHLDFHADVFGHSQSNVSFLKGQIENLGELNLKNNYFDIVTSNCVINLSPDKESVLKEAYRILKVGGELYFSDVYASRRIPRSLQNDPVLYGECLSGALYWNDFQNLAKKVGFADPRVISAEPIEITNKKVKEKIEGIQFCSVTYRLFKLPHLEADCEDYGQAVIYKGGLPESPNEFFLDRGHVFQKGKIYPVCGNSYVMLKDSRFAEHFEFIGTWDTHYGIFEGCGTNTPFEFEGINSGSTAQQSNSCC